MPTGEQRPSIPPGDILGLLAKAEINNAAPAAAAMLTNYTSNRSVALLLRSSPASLEVGSGVCVRIDDRYFVATVKHNLQDDSGDDLQISDVEVRSRGEKYGEPLRVLRTGLSPDLDLAWLELDPEDSKRPHLAFVATDQTGFLREEHEQPCFLLGYPAQMADKPPDAQQRPLLESAAVLTLSIAPARRRSPADNRTFTVEYPPHDGSLDDWAHELHGISGGGVWLFPRFEDHPVWSPEKARLVGIARSWRRQDRKEVAIRVECWLQLVANQISKT